MRLFSVPSLSQRVLLCQKRRKKSWHPLIQRTNFMDDTYVCTSYVYLKLCLSPSLFTKNQLMIFTLAHKHICTAWLTHVLQKHLVFLCAHTTVRKTERRLKKILATRKWKQKQTNALIQTYIPIYSIVFASNFSESKPLFIVSFYKSIYRFNKQTQFTVPTKSIPSTFKHSNPHPITYVFCTVYIHYMGSNANSFHVHTSISEHRCHQMEKSNSVNINFNNK